MATPALDRPVHPSLLKPAIHSLRAPERAPMPRVREPDVVGVVAGRTRSWFGHPQELPGRVTAALWTVLLGAGAVGGWLVAVRAGATTCSGPVCRLVTLGHPGLQLILVVACVLTLLGLAPVTAGLTRAGGPEFGAMVVGGAAGALSLLGIAALALLTVLAGFLALAAVVAALERN
jgi:hypothetical protein